MYSIRLHRAVWLRNAELRRITDKSLSSSSHGARGSTKTKASNFEQHDANQPQQCHQSENLRNAKSKKPEKRIIDTDHNPLTMIGKYLENIVGDLGKNIKTNITKEKHHSSYNDKAGDGVGNASIQEILAKLKNQTKHTVNAYLQSNPLSQLAKAMRESEKPLAYDSALQLAYDDILLDVLEERVRASTPVNKGGRSDGFWNFTHAGTEADFNESFTGPTAANFPTRVNVEARIGNSEAVVASAVPGGRGFASERFNFGSGSNFKAPSGYALVCPLRARQFVLECFRVVGESKRNSMVIAEHMISSDEKNSRKFGIKTLDTRLTIFKRNRSIIEPLRPQIMSEDRRVAFVDGCQMSGTIVGTFATVLASLKAEQTGSALVCIRNSSNYGLCSFYTELAQSEGLMCMTYSRKRVIHANGGSTSSFNPQGMGLTNSVTISGAGLNTDGFVIDLTHNLNSKADDPISDQIQPIRTTNEFGKEVFGSELFFEIFNNIFEYVIDNSECRQEIERHPLWNTASMTQCIMMLDPLQMNQGMREQIQDLIDATRTLPMINKHRKYVVPGDIEIKEQSAVHSRGGILYHQVILDDMNEIAKKLKVDPIQKIPYRY